MLHWFRTQDLRAEDNRALYAASQKAREGPSSFLLTCFLWSPEDLKWHGTGPARTDFMLESLRLLLAQLHALDIPLVVLTAETRGDKVAKVLEFIKKHHVSHVFVNIEYEIDELRRDIHLLEELLGGQDDATATRFELLHDQTVMEPGAIKNPKGGRITVYTSYYDAWLAQVAKRPELLDLVDLPAANDNKARAELRDLFQSEIPSLPKEKQFASRPSCIPRSATTD